MKTKFVIFWLSVCILTYLVFSLAVWCLNPALWEKDVRIGLASVIGVITLFCSIIFMFMSFPPPNEKL